MIKRLSTPQRWKFLEKIFRKHTSQMYEIFWETIEIYVRRRKMLLSNPFGALFIAANIARYSLAVRATTGALDNRITFIDKTVLLITLLDDVARLDDDAWKIVVRNGRKRKQSWKFRAVTAPDSIFYIFCSPMEARKNYSILYSISMLDDELESFLQVGDTAYCIHSDSEYN